MEQGDFVAESARSKVVSCAYSKPNTARLEQQLGLFDSQSIDFFALTPVWLRPNVDRGHAAILSLAQNGFEWKHHQ